ncbi:hypothetical protein TeGR_g5370, partial [Tetraparma gracilis]
MGSQFSMGMYPEILIPFTSLDLESLRRALNKFQRMCSKEYENDGFFMTRAQFQELFVTGSAVAKQLEGNGGAMSEASHAFRIFSFFDPAQSGSVVASDIWGAFCLSSSAKEEMKLNFLFQLADANSDGHLNSTELAMVMHSSSRGFSRMKTIGAPDMDRIQKIVDASFSHPEVHLDERGELSLPDLHLMASADPRLRNYLSNLDSSAGADIGNLYKQQANFLRELAMIDSVLDTMERHDRDMTVDEDAYEKERGGDVADIVYDGLFENPEDVARLYLTELLEQADYDNERQKAVDAQNRRTRLGTATTFDEEVPLTFEEQKAKERDKQQFLAEASRQ